MSAEHYQLQELYRNIMSRKSMKSRPFFPNRVNRADLQLNPFKPNIEKVFRYCDAYIATISGVGTATTQSFRLNACHDIDLSGTGHQPRGYDQLVSSSGPYTKYRVMRNRGRLTAHLRASNTTAIDTAIITAFPSIPTSAPSPASGGLASIASNLELPGATFCLATQADPRSLEWDFYLWDVFGKKKSQYLDDEGYGGDAGAVPSLVCNLITQCQSIAGSSATDAGICAFIVEMELTVRLEQPIPLGSS
jgi:hypothetical protein